MICWVCGKPGTYSNENIGGFHLCDEHGAIFHKATDDWLTLKDKASYLRYVAVWTEYYLYKLPNTER